MNFENRPNFDAALVREAAHLARSELALAHKLARLFGPGTSLGGALAKILSATLACIDVPSATLQSIFDEVYVHSPDLGSLAALDLQATLRRDPASRSSLSVVMYHKGFHALQTHRIAHSLWERGRCDLARHLQWRASCEFAVDIHPACCIGHSTMLDHATGIVIGETCVIRDGVSILQGVTLGGTGKSRGDRHPKVADGVLIGAGATLLGAIQIGTGSKIGAGSVVLADVPAHKTVVGIPARVVGHANTFHPAEDMDHSVCTASEATNVETTDVPRLMA